MVQARPAVLPAGQERRAGAVAFSYVDRPELIEDFLKPPMSSGPRGVARFRYPDRPGKARVFDLPLEGQEGKSIPLPDSDLTVKVEKVADFPASEGGLSRVLGEAAIPVGMFQVSKGRRAPGRALRHGLAADGPERHAQPARSRGQALRSRWSRST